MTLSFRKFDSSDKDYDISLAIHNAVWPDEPSDEAVYRHHDKERNPKYYWTRVIGEVDGEPTGYGVYCETWWNENPDEYTINWLTHPDYLDQGHGSAFYEYALGKLHQDRDKVAQLTAGTREDKPKAVSFLEELGFGVKERYQRSELKLNQFDDAQFAHYHQRMADNGIVIKQLSDLQKTDSEWQRKLWDLEWVLEQDEPTPDPPKRQPFDEYVRHTFGAPDFTPESWFIATDGDNYAGMSCLWKDEAVKDRLHTGWTGVDRPYRKKGIALAMKLNAFEYAREYGATHIRTDNHDTNWMYQINLRLGFEPIPAWLHCLKKMD